MAGKTICILGGGSGGLVVANILKKELSGEHRIVLIDKESYHLFNPSLLWLMVGWRRPEQMKKDLKDSQKQRYRLYSGRGQRY